MHPEDRKVNHNHNHNHNYTDYQLLGQNHPYILPFLSNGKYTFSYDGQCALTRALFKENHNVDIEILPNHLIPALPSRVAYLQIVHRVLRESGLLNEKVRGLDVGTGAYGVYAILGVKLYGWRMVGVDVDKKSLVHAGAIIEKNGMSEEVALIEGDGLLVDDEDEDGFDFTVCNPPFYRSLEDMESRSDDKGELRRDGVVGTDTELVYEGGEVAFVKKLISDSSHRSRKKPTWYSSMLGTKASVQELIQHLIDSKITNFTVQTYQLGNTRRWILFWSHGYYHPLVYHQNHQGFKHVPVTVEEGKFDLTKVQNVLETLPLEIEALKGRVGNDDEVQTLIVNSPGVVWSRAYRRHPERLDKSPLRFIISRDEIHFQYGESFKSFQSFHTYLLGKLK